MGNFHPPSARIPAAINVRGCLHIDRKVYCYNGSDANSLEKNVRTVILTVPGIDLSI